MGTSVVNEPAEDGWEMKAIPAEGSSGDSTGGVERK